ncbi:MAG TPA: acyltransferase family protein [Solirubrobacteraceae bacterium]|nr:acyltransferase family protein [Solirubrobacteraceae bacterium]
MPEPVGSSQRYMPGLDGLRALAVLAVVAYHLEFSWAQGGLLGVGVFFTLSGYLITDILLMQAGSGGIALGRFWLARARRLLPALYAMLAVVASWVALFGPAQPAQFNHAIAAAALYVSNWQLIVQHQSYFARFGPVAPLSHLWSLGVEEQFYLVWPLLLLLGLRLVHERGGRPALRPRLAGLTLILAATSAVEMALLYRPSFDPSRVYFGTDTRAFELLAGAALAMVWPSARLRRGIAGGARRTLDALGAVCVAAIVILMWRSSEYSWFLYRGGFVLLSLASAGAIAVLVHPACRLGDLLGCRPLRWIGARSYGIYLWSVPILALSTPVGAHGVDLVRAALQVFAIFAVAGLSWRFVEQPVRHGALGRLWGRLGAGDWRSRDLARGHWAALAGSLALLAMAGVGLALRTPLREAPDSVSSAESFSTGAASANASSTGAASANASRSFLAGDGARDAGAGRAGASPDQAGGAADPGDATGATGTGATGVDTDRAATSGASSRSSCGSVVDIGDSTSEGLISPDYLPDPRQRIEAQYADVGVRVQHYEIAGARSIVERYEEQPNAYEAAERWKRAGYHGCWVLALGTNDAADVYVGSNVGLGARIEKMMSLIGDEPVLWVDVKTQLASGPYAEQNMRLWNSALLAACRRHPNMRVFDWAAVVKSEWFISDGIHYNTPGYAARSRLIAQALARAFPADGAEAGCLVD